MPIIGRKEIINRYEDQNEIIAEGYEKDCVEPAAYELRVADTELKTDDEGPVYDGDRIDNPFYLPSRSISVVSSKEILDMPDNLCGRVGIRLKFAKKGLIPMFGPQVDPGYNGRFYGVVYNASGEKVRICEGERFFKMELQEVDGCEASEGSPKKLRDGLHDINTSAPGIQGFKQRLDDLENDATKHRERVIRVEEGYNQIVLFGVFLLATTVFGVMLDSLMSTLDSVTLGMNLETGALALFLVGWWVTLGFFVYRLSSGDGENAGKSHGSDDAGEEAAGEDTEEEADGEDADGNANSQ